MYEYCAIDCTLLCLIYLINFIFATSVKSDRFFLFFFFCGFLHAGGTARFMLRFSFMYEHISDGVFMTD